MRNLVSAYRSRLLGQAAAIAIIAGFGAGCSDATHPGEPFFTGSTANQREIIGSATAQPMPGPIPPGAVTSSNLPPPPGAVASAAPYAPPPGAAPGPGWTAVGGKVVTVGPGESLDTLAIKYGVPSAQIARTNGISSPSQITAGRTLIIPQPTGQAAAYAAAEPLPSPGAAAPAARTTVIAVKGGDVVHVVAPGETLYGIAKASGVNAQDIVALNGMSSETVRIGQKLRMPNGALPKAQVASAKTETQVATLGAPPKPLGTLTVKPGGQAVASAPAAAAVPAAPAATDLPSAPSAAKAPTTDRRRRGRRRHRAAIGERDDVPLAGPRPHHLRLRRQAERRAERRHQSRGAGRHFRQGRRGRHRDLRRQRARGLRQPRPHPPRRRLGLGLRPQQRHSGQARRSS